MDCDRATKSLSIYFIIYILDVQDIVNWKSNAVTITSLVILNLGYIIWRSLDVSIISSIAHKFFVFSLIMLAKHHLIGTASDCDWFHKDKVEKTYVAIYQGINLSLDKLRNVVLLHEIPSLIRVIT